MKSRIKKLKWLLARIRLIECKVLPLRFTAQGRFTQSFFAEEELDRINGILKNALKEILKLRIRRYNKCKKKTAAQLGQVKSFSQTAEN